jgi:ABC-type glycerol-3-phosphate transport system substrate-binding protein
MGFSMMFYRMDVLAELNQAVPETWGELLSILPTLQSNNMQIGVSYTLALEFMIYQKGGSMWKYEDEELYDSIYAGAKIDLDSDVALESFEFVCRLYSDYSFPVSYDSSNRFRTGEMPIIIGDYASIYNTLVVYATEIEGMWEFCPLPGSETGEVDEATGKKIINYNSLAGVSATVMLHGCDNLQAAWTFLQWQTSAKAQADYGNKMVALIGPSAKYETANLNAIKDLSWTAKERAAIMNQMDNLSSIVNYPGSYIINRYTQFAFLDAVNESADPIDALSSYIEAINSELTRKRKEFKDAGLWYPEKDDDMPEELTAQ